MEKSRSGSKFFRRLLKWLLALFIILNIMAALHAYKFTHFDASAGKRVEAQKLSFAQKARMILIGPSLPRPKDTKTPAQPYESLTIQSNVRLEAWYIKAVAPKGTVLLFHGYQGTKSDLLPAAAEFLKMGYNTLLVDFMGSGGSEGNSTTIGAKEGREVKDCFDYIKQRGEKNIYLYGSSMGAAAIMKAIDACAIAPKGIILGCPFGSMYKTVCARFKIMGIPKVPLAGMLTFWGGVENGFWAFSHNPQDYAKNISCPALLLYGAKDNRVSREEIDAIYNNLNGPKTLKVFPGAGHGQYLDAYPDEWVEWVGKFMADN